MPIIERKEFLCSCGYITPLGKEHDEIFCRACGNVYDQYGNLLRNIFPKGYDYYTFKKYDYDNWLKMHQPKLYHNPCDGCPNAPRNGEFKACNCTLPYFNNPTNSL